MPQRRSPSSTASCNRSPADPLGCQRRSRGRDAVSVSPGHQLGSRSRRWPARPPRPESTRWPEFAATAVQVSIAGLAKIPTRLDNQIIVAFNLYSTKPRQWSDEAIEVARVLATSYVLNASKTAPAGATQREAAESTGLTTHHRTSQTQNRLTARGHGRSGLLAHAQARNHNAILRKQPWRSSRGASGLSFAAVAVEDLRRLRLVDMHRPRLRQTPWI